MLKLLFTHPLEFRTLLQFYVYHEQKRDITAQQEHPTSGWDRQSMRRCWDFLDMTSRSFSAVIKELDGDLARTVSAINMRWSHSKLSEFQICLFYLVLRGLDTIEDDMTIPNEEKQKLLRSFHELTVTPGWNFNGNGPNEKDRQLLVEYDCVVTEVNLLTPEYVHKLADILVMITNITFRYKAVIIDICQKMQTGMADFANAAAMSPDKAPLAVQTVAEYDLYCHYVAGLVGEGLSGIWSASGKEDPKLKYQLELSNSMGLLLQKTNIIRDFREDADEARYFWPREIWGAHGFTNVREMYDDDPAHMERAEWVLSGMVLDALRHATDSLDYLRLLTNQTVFTFCAIPATMAMATLALCFANPAVFRRNIKIRKAEAARLIMRSTNARDASYMFRDYARAIHAKASPSDPYFLRIAVACGKVS